MSFALKNFKPIGGQTRPFNLTTKAGAPAMWSYATDDDAATVNTSGYFNDISGMLSIWDRIQAIVDVDGTPSFLDFIVVSNSGGVVDVSDGVTIALTDGD